MSGTKAPVSTVSNLQNNPSAIQVINENDDTLSDAVQRSLSRQVELDSEGDPISNAMETDLDMNDNRIQNLPSPVSDHEPARHGDIQSYVDAAQDAQAAAEAAQAAAETAQAAAELAETHAETAETNAETAEANAEIAEAAAAVSAAAALVSENNAETAESNAAASAAAALTSENNAETAETNAETAEANAETAQGLAEAAQAAAEAAQALAEAAAEDVDLFRDIYCGASATDPTTDLNGNPVAAGDFYYNTTSDVWKAYDGAVWVNLPVNTLDSLDDVDLSDLADGDKLSYDSGDGKWHNVAATAGEGDVISDETTTTDGQLPVFSGTDGKRIKKSTLSGILKAASGVVSAAVSATDYAPATSGSAILRGDGAGGFAATASGTDYAPATSGTAALKGNGAGGFGSAAIDDLSDVVITAAAAGDILRHNGSNFVNVPGWQLIAETSPTTATSVPFTGLSGYSAIMLLLLDVTTGSSENRRIQVSSDNGSNYDATSGHYAQIATTGVETASTAMSLLSANSASARTAWIVIHGWNTAKPKIIDSTNLNWVYDQSTALDAIRVIADLAVSVQLTAGTIYCFGRR